MLISFLSYTSLFFWARGNIRPSETHWWGCTFHRNLAIDPSESERISARMIVYPIAFAVTTLPVSAVRWQSGFGNGGHNLSTWTFVTASIYNLTGAFNVFLFLYTRLNLLCHRRSGIPPALSGVPIPLSITPRGAAGVDLPEVQAIPANTEESEPTVANVT